MIAERCGPPEGGVTTCAYSVGVLAFANDAFVMALSALIIRAGRLCAHRRKVPFTALRCSPFRVMLPSRLAGGANEQHSRDPLCQER